MVEISNEMLTLSILAQFSISSLFALFISVESVKSTDNKTLGLTKSKNDSFTIALSTPERAIMELIYQIPKHAHYEDAQLTMESLSTLRPKAVQSLLEDCNSIKVKRLFMWLAEYNQHKWVERIDLNKIDFGEGKRTIVKGGYFDNKYQITIPKYSERRVEN